MQINYRTREVSTIEIYNAFDPPLIFQVKNRAPNGWPGLVSELEDSKLKDISLAIQILHVLCLSVSDGNETHPLTTLEKVEDFYQMFQNVVPGLANEIICNLAYNLALDYLNEKKIELETLKIRPEPYANGSKEKIQASEL